MDKAMILSFVEASPLFTKTRIPSLFSDYRRLEDSNPEGYEANLAAWKTVFTKYFEAKSQSGAIVQLISEDNILQPLSSPHNGVPLAIDLAIDSLIASGYLLPLSKHLECFLLRNIANANHKAQNNSYAVSAFKWAFYKTTSLLFSPHKGIYPTICGPKGPGSLRSERFVVKPTLVKYGSRVNKAYHEKISRGYIESIYSWQLFYKEVNSLLKASLSKTDVLSILAYLYQNKLVVVDYQDLDESEAEDFEKHVDTIEAFGQDPDLVVKFYMASPTPVNVRITDNTNGTKLNSQTYNIITNQDKAVARLRDTHLTLNNRINGLATQSNQATLKAQELVARGSRSDKVIAKYALKSRNMIDRALENAVKQLENLDQLISSIDAAINVAQVTDALEQGVSIIKSINDQIGGVERVNRVVQETEEGIESVKEMEDTIGLAVNNAVDDAEIMDELDKLELEEMQRAEQSLSDSLTDNLADTLAGLDLTKQMSSVAIQEKNSKTKDSIQVESPTDSKLETHQQKEKGKEPMHA
ncbi:hypothetical protein NADFUDRAFT_48626 [Nadsonia fulvescens var. elongata DSM 6958]|uniref:Vacuolar-sorting protein SNF7 n=1 Tax=Nadsonia fulvescens var. elongata DSM 6958 TaxID=857566 RepID=A0A1E3PRQ0_9ASCO|nr:hypothetical protein NADFUDRAFT_48626 [Nadsonia fulvescens var. elongata DSM 6958]